MKEEYIESKDLTLSASIASHNFRISVKMISPVQAVFLIPKTPTTEALIDSFRVNKLFVDPIAFTNAKFDLLRTINQLKEEQQ